MAEQYPLGFVKTFPNGARGKWDGTGFEAVDAAPDTAAPPASPATPPPPSASLGHEPDTWWGGFAKGALGDKSLMTAAGIGAAGLAIPTGGASLAGLPGILAGMGILGAGGAAGAGAANLVRQNFDSRPQHAVSDDMLEGGMEGAAGGVIGPALSATGRGLAAIGSKMSPWGRRIVGSGLGGIVGHSPLGIGGGGAAGEILLNPEIGPAAMQSVGDAATPSTVKSTIQDLLQGRWSTPGNAAPKTSFPPDVEDTLGGTSLSELRAKFGDTSLGKLMRGSQKTPYGPEPNPAAGGTPPMPTSAQVNPNSTPTIRMDPSQRPAPSRSAVPFGPEAPDPALRALTSYGPEYRDIAPEPFGPQLPSNLSRSGNTMGMDNPVAGTVSQVPKNPGIVSGKGNITVAPPNVAGDWHPTTVSRTPQEALKNLQVGQTNPEPPSIVNDMPNGGPKGKPENVSGAKAGSTAARSVDEAEGLSADQQSLWERYKATHPGTTDAELNTWYQQQGFGADPNAGLDVNAMVQKLLGALKKPGRR